VESFESWASSWAGPYLTLAIVAGLAFLATLVGLRAAASVGRRGDLKFLSWTAEASGRALCLLVPVAAIRVALPALDLQDPADGIIDHTTRLLLIAGFGWLLVSLTLVFDRHLNARYLLDVVDNLAARRIHTRFRLMRRALVSAIGILTFAGMLMTFPAARSLGTGLFASAGIAGIALGIAARPTIEAWIASIQLAVTELIHIDDVVIVEGEWGRIEEITTTYVVVCLWDLRRLIVPVRHFIEKPFQNWTRTTSDLLGAITVDVDYRTPVEEVRSAVEDFLRESAIWNGEFWNLQVVDASAQTMRLRVLVSAANANQAWDLRCEVREKLIAHLQERHPEALPRTRATLEGPLVSRDA
jgi:small-conductance mechanosensitive channel